MEAAMVARSLIALLLALFAASTAAQSVDCRKVPDHPNCAPRG
jgi:hypothetical protein